MNIHLVTPAMGSVRNGNSITAQRWARILKSQGHRVDTKQAYEGRPCDVLIALHARRSYESIRRYRELHPGAPLIVVLTGTDLYRDIQRDRKARHSLELATRLVVLQKMGIRELPHHLRKKTEVIYQSATPVKGFPGDPQKNFTVCVIGHMRREKDPFRTAMAVRGLPASSRIRVVHVGRPMDPHMARRLKAEIERNGRYRWLGELPHWKTRRVLARSHLLSLTSYMEGSSNALSEGLVSSVPVVASKIPGLVGTLGSGYPGYFRVGDTAALTRLLIRAETDRKFYETLALHCAQVTELVRPENERRTWRRLLAELL